MSSLFAQMKLRPSLFALAGTVGATCAASCVYGLYKMNSDQDLVYDSKRNPFPYLRSRQQPHLMFTKVGQRGAEGKEHYDLLDILNGKYGDN